MKRTTIVAPDEVLDKLRWIASEEGVSLATVIREALEERASRHRPKPRSLGAFASGYTDTARRASEGLRKLRILGIDASGHTDTARRAGDEPPEPNAWR